MDNPLFNGHLSQLKTAFTLLLMQVFLSTLSLSYVPLFFYNQGYSLPSLLLLFSLTSALSVLTFPLVKRFSLRRFLLLGNFSYILINLALFFNLGKISFFLYILFGATTALFFWVAFNQLYFVSSSLRTHGVDSSLYRAAPALLGIFVPTLGAALIKWGSYPWLFGLAALLYIFPLVYTYQKVPEQKIPFDFNASHQAFQSLKTLTLAEGALHFFPGVIIPVFALLFLKEEMEFGFFFGYLGLISFIIALILAYRSDRNHKRLAYLYPLFLLMAASLFLFPLAKSLLWWLVLVGIFSVLDNISFPLRLAVSLDVKEVNLGFWMLREFYLVLGRAVVLGISFIFFYYHLYWPVFVLFALLALVYPFLVKYKFRELK